MTSPTDTRAHFFDALGQAEKLILATPADHAGDPTPCDEWTVHQLVEHMIGVVRRVGTALQGAPMTGLVDFTSTQWAQDLAGERTRTTAVLGDDAVLERELTVPWGTTTGARAIDAWAAELTAHSWDLAKATGRVADLDTELGRRALAIQQHRLPPGPREGIPFDSPIDVASDDPYARLAGWLGRDPEWSAGR
ncbi:MAG: TIGR03086 family metal-binding protein [Beutenbergiaceae bacterium]